MVVEIRTSQDLLNLLDNNEEFRRAARRALLTDDLLELPDLVREMQQTQRLMIQRMAQLAERMDRMDERQGRMEERMDRMDARFEEMGATVAHIDERVGSLDERVGSLDERVGSLDERVGNLDERVDGLSKQVGNLDERVDGLSKQVGNLDERVDGLSGQVGVLSRQVGDVSGRLRGWELERGAVGRLLPRLAQEYDVARIKAVSADSSRSAVRVRAVWETRFVEAVEAGVDEGRITEDEADALDRTDIVARGRRRVDRAELWFAVQASATLDNNDIERAATGAVALGKLSGDRAVAVVYGRRIAGQQRVRADELGVAVMLDEEGEQG